VDDVKTHAGRGAGRRRGAEHAGPVPDSRQMFAKFASLSSKIQAKIIEVEAAPNTGKTLRLFPTSEAARYLGVSENHLRTITRERDDLPTGSVVGGNNRRAFSLAEINAIRRGLHAQTGDRRYLPRREGQEKLQVISIANFKGGAAKTTTAAHLAQYLALRGYRVLVVDLDSQGSLTALFGIQPDRDLTGSDTLYPLFRDETNTLEGIARPTYWDGLDLVPANLELYQAEYEVPVRRLREGSWHFWRVLDDALETVADRYDVVVCDCPPSLGYLSMNGVMAATSIVVPVPPAMMDFSSTGCFFRMMSEMMEVIGGSEGVTKSFDFVRILTSRFDTADQNHKQVARWMALTYGEWLMENRMILTTALDAAGTRKATYYEAGHSSGSRVTYLRGLDSFDAVNQEIEDLILGVWGRQQIQREAV